ncbi:hypothetical protein N665_0545s0001 [Sinapis alba]|nr:hypothetical protein N665_0545s0001 [Sinapis alba]
MYMDTKTAIYKPPIHEHPLYYSARFAISSRCSGCDTVDNIYSGYFCNKLGCSVWLHKECAEAPLEINHPFHPEHPILLTNDIEDSRLHNFRQCYLCGLILSPLRYSCSSCEFRVDIACGMKPWPHTIEHPLCHDHPLIFRQSQYAPCEVCNEFIRVPSYFCTECEVYFHAKCICFSTEVNHPCHSNHPLEFTAFDTLIYDPEKTCLLCEEKPRNVYYHCSICNFTTCLPCTRSPPPLVVEHMKTHQHPLTRLSKRILYICDVCGMQRKTKKHHGSYICHQCDFVIHGRCIGFPHVININRHVHRISFTHVLGAGYSKCGVCYKSISQYHGAYSCSVCPKYAVHSDCAVDTNTVWDGVELEGVPDDTEDTAPYKVIGVELISHVSHVKHNLKFYKDNIHYDHEWIQCDEWIRCEACIDPVGYDAIYACKECFFVLHEKCANLPIKRKHLFAIRPYMLEVNNTGTAFECWLCSTISNGFKYSEQGSWKADVRCCSLSEPFIHAGHLHPLYFKKIFLRNWVQCNACTIFPLTYVLRCDACNFSLCLFCATLPLKTWQRTDEHPLTLCCGKEASGEYWCEICEKSLDPSLWFYTCSDCRVTLHARCVIGDFSRINAGSTIEFRLVPTIYEAVPNNRSTRPLCSECHSRCISSIILRKKNEDNKYFCSRFCLKVPYG